MIVTQSRMQLTPGAHMHVMVMHVLPDRTRADAWVRAQQ